MKDISNQVGCGYCANERICPIRNPHINKAKQGCAGFIHFTKEGLTIGDLKNKTINIKLNIYQ